MALTLSSQVFGIVRQLVEEKAGLHYEPADLPLIESRLANRALETGFDSLLDYYYYLRYDPEGPRELQNLVESLVVHETYLFREPEALGVLVNDVVPELLRDRPRLRLWSAACATGEEPYTVAMLLQAAGLLDRVDVVASDISAPALARAREGFYAGRALRALPESSAARCLEPSGRGVRVPDSIRRRITWTRVNLVDRESVAAQGRFDVVLCRNVLIYFSDATVSAVAASLADTITPGGVLLVGTSESLLRFGTSFVCEERGGSFLYRAPS
ncbi:MAG TPA: CheR family methyltransferase [Polyangiaceae bacterium]|jgi:chemotaxis protein methyltransferase CheR